MEGIRPWRKILYERQNYPDNYIPESFLDNLDEEICTTPKSNTVLRPSLSFAALLDSCSIVFLQITVLTLFLTVFKYIDKKIITLLGIFTIDSIIIFIGAVYQIYIGLFRQSAEDLGQTCFIFGSCLTIATPIVQSLTANYSRRTINALTLFFSCMHIALYDYAFINSIDEQFSGNLSLNSAVFVSILLASRIDNMHVVIFFLLFAVICFILFPECARVVKQYSQLQHYSICLILYAVTSVLLFFLSRALLIVYQLAMLAVLALCPLLLRHMHTYKKALRGLWDVAPVEV